MFQVGFEAWHSIFKRSRTLGVKVHISNVKFVTAECINQKDMTCSKNVYLINSIEACGQLNGVRFSDMTGHIAYNEKNEEGLWLITSQPSGSSNTSGTQIQTS
jgi:hypothetical protein